MASPKLVSSRVIYMAVAPYDESRPEFDCYNPVETGEWWIVDCWPCDMHGNIHPGYNVSPVPVHTENLIEKVGAVSAGAFFDPN